MHQTPSAVCVIIQQQLVLVALFRNHILVQLSTSCHAPPGTALEHQLAYVHLTHPICCNCQAYFAMASVYLISSCNAGSTHYEPFTR